MKLLQINDVHMSDQAPSMRTDHYREQILAKVAKALALGIREGIDLGVFTGDLFHRKAANHTSHLTIQRLSRLFGDSGLMLAALPGNHDTARGTHSIDGQPYVSLSNLLLTEPIDPDEATPEGLPGGVMFMPWNNAMEQEGGAHWIANEVERVGTPEVVMAHAPVTLDPYPFGPEALGWIDAHELAALLPPSVKVFAHGHMHKGHEVTNIGGVLFSNPGALARVTIGDDDRDRQPQVAIIEERVAGWSVTYHAIDHEPAGVVYRLTAAEMGNERATGIAALSSSLAAVGTHVVTVETLVAEALKQERPDGVPEADWAAGIDEAIAALEDA